MATPFSMSRDINGYNGFGLAFCLDKYSADLAQNTDTSLVVPTSGMLGNVANNVNKYIAIFSYEPGASVWVALNATAADPAGAGFAATTSELNPAARMVSAGDTLHFFTSNTSAQVGVTFYSLNV